MSRVRRPLGRLVLAIATALSGATLALPATAGSVDLPPSFGGAFSVPVKSVREMRAAATVRQQYDFSCGSAALATLLSHHYGLPTSEQAAFDEMVRLGDAQQIRQSGFSMLDMKRFLQSRGITADGFEAPLQSLVEAGAPAIVLIDQGGFHHFVVVKGIEQGRVLFGDPASGTRSIALESFEAMRANDIVFVITDRAGTFNAAVDWAARPAAPLGTQGRGPLGSSPWLRLDRADL